MKKKIILPLFIFLYVFNCSNVFCQLDESKWNLMLIREDMVYPSMTNEYERTLTDMKEFLTENKVEEFNYFTHMQDDYIFSHVTPIKKLGDLNKGIHSYMAQKVNNPELDLIFKYLNETIESYRYYIMQYQPELSYVPAGEDWSEGNSYRKWSYYYFEPGTEKEVEAVFNAWKNLYVENGIKAGYRVFSGFLGVEQPLYMLTTWAEDPLDYHETMQVTIDLLGEEATILWSKMLEFVEEAKVIEGWFLPQYSYAPGIKMAE